MAIDPWREGYMAVTDRLYAHCDYTEPECPYEENTGSYNSWWYGRMTAIEDYYGDTDGY